MTSSSRSPGPLAVSTSQPQFVRGLALMAGGMLLIPVMDAIAKILGERISPGMVAWGRVFFQTILTGGAVLAILCPVGLIPKQLWPNVLRGILIAFASFSFFAALTVMPLAETLAIFFVEPFILTVLSALLLGETVGWRRRIAVLVGFLGALLIIQPTFAEVGWAVVLPLIAAFCFALYLIITRQAAAHDPGLTMQFTSGVAGTLFMTALLLISQIVPLPGLQPSMPDVNAWLLLATIGAIATVGHLMVVAAAKAVPTSILAPFQYLEIVSATVLGLWIFGDFPDALTWLGITIICVSGGYVFWREAQIKSDEHATPD
ncbi:MAG: DMT family transporter [Pseudomonadota bacterium]